MTNRHRISGFACLAFAVLALAGCVPPKGSSASGYTEPQRGPDLTRALAPDSATMNNSSGSASAAMVPGSDAAAALGGKTIRVGLLLPLTGRNADLGRAMQDAATVSLFDKYSQLSPTQQVIRVELLPKDTGDTPEQARRAMQAALADGAQFIIGPLFADATEAAAPLAKEKNVSVLSLSNNRAHATEGTYMFGFSPQEQTVRIVTYAIGQGKSKLAVLAPTGALGDTVVGATKDTLKSVGMVLAAEARYGAQGSGIDAALNTLMGRGQGAFDALLIPEGGPALDTIMRALAARGVTPANVQFLGTGIWDDAAILTRVNLEGAWFASSPPNSTKLFENRFRATYNYVPPRIASLSYDAVALAVTLATSGRPYDAMTLTNMGGFVGPANGIFRLRPNGVTERGLAVITVQNGVLKVMSPPPTGFAK